MHKGPPDNVPCDVLGQETLFVGKIKGHIHDSASIAQARQLHIHHRFGITTYIHMVACETFGAYEYVRSRATAGADTEWLTGTKRSLAGSGPAEIVNPDIPAHGHALG